MSISLPENTTLQLSDNSGNIFHQGVLMSNVNNTSLLSTTFPTTSTGTSLCHALYTNSSNGSLKFLNASGSGTGGHEFWTSNSTTAPIQTASLDVSGFSIIKDNTITTYDTYETFASGPTFIIMATNPSVPPYNWILGQMYIIQVGNTTATMSTGVNYNVKYIDTQAVRVYTTSSDTSPVIDSSGITSVLIPTGTSGTINTSLLSSTDLTFNNVSLQTTLNNLTIKQTTAVNQGLSLAIFADARPALAPTATISQQYAFSPSWYFKNIFVSNNKINWYFVGSLGMTVAQVLGMYINIFNGLTTSNDNSPFLVIYTQPQAGDPNFYRSKRVYIFDQSIQPTVNTRYFMFANVSGTCPTPYTPFISTLINTQLSPVAGSNVGPFAPTELILAFNISTNSTSVINSVEFAVNKFGIMTPTGTQELLFIPT
jgi:hypothetical protein